jgi:phage minor structural protein
MQCIFLNAAGVTLFVRDDMESGHWVQEQMSVTADFPFVAGKVIERGQRIAFRDPATDVLQVFEIRQVVNNEPDHFQQITAEHICISELTDEHINKTEITDQTALQALTTALTGTLWSAGTSTDATVQSADFSRGSVWDAVNTIQQNWNVYIKPRIVISSAGSITGRYLDIVPAHGVSHGLRLSVRKNLLDPAVTYDDEGVITAMCGYGGNVDVPHTGEQDTTEELTFADEVWTATDGHPAKPSGQTYLEWPEKTALYGRNGRPRFGYYQNGSIKDASVLLEKTWESLQQSCDPKITIAGTVVDLYRLGYKDQPLALHETAIIEIEETGELFAKEIICCDIDLVDPTGSRVEIGDYIPNIVYISRDTDRKASGGGGGGSGRGSMTNLEDDDVKTWTEFVRTQDKVGMVVGTFDGTDKILGGQIVLAINDDGGTTALIQANTIDIDGIVLALRTKYLIVSELEAGTINATVSLWAQTIESNSDVVCADLKVNAGGSSTLGDATADSLVINTGGTSSLQAATCTSLTVPDGSLTVGANAASWQSFTYRHVSLTNAHNFDYTDTGGSGTVYGSLVGSHTDSTIYFVGRHS